MPRPKRKTEITTLKMTPEVRALWERCAELERRSLTNMFEVMVRAYAKQVGVSVEALAESPSAPHGPTAGSAS